MPTDFQALRAKLFNQLFWVRHASWVHHQEPEPPPVEPKHLSEAPQWMVTEWKGPLPYGAQGSERLTLDAARERLDAEIVAYLREPAPQYALLVKAIPGLGKTTAAVKAIENVWDYSQGKVMYAGPRHDFFDDLMNVQTMNSPDNWLHWMARQAEDAEAGKLETCRYADAMALWLQRGHRAYCFCRDVCGGAYLDNDCIYNAQTRSPCPVVYCQHQHVTMGHPMLADFGVLIGDEWPLSAFTEVWTIPERWIISSTLDLRDDFTILLSQLRTLSESGQAFHGESLIEHLGGPDRVLAASERLAHTTIAPEHIWPPRLKRGRPDDVDKVDYCHTLPLAKLLYREATMAKEERPYIWRVWLGDHVLRLYQRRAPKEGAPARMIWLDATANVTLYEKLFHRKFKVLDLSPRMEGRIFQVADRAYGKGSVLKGADPDSDESTDKIRALEHLVSRLIEMHGYTVPGIVAAKNVLERSPYFQAMIHANFYGARGTNVLEVCDGVFVLGTPQPSGYAVADIARSVWYERDELFDTKRYAEPCPYNYIDEDGKAWAYPVNSYWADEALYTVLEATREDEIVQAVHRARPLSREVDVWLLSTTPTSLPLTKLTSSRELFGAPDGVEAGKWDRVIQWIEQSDVEVITVSMVAKAAGVSAPSARAYMQRLVDEGDWEWTEAVTRARGRPAKGVTRARN